MRSPWFALTLFITAPVLFAPSVSAAERMEIGELNGAAFRIDVPEQWNGSLVLYCHGYAVETFKFKDEKPGAIERVFLDAHFAVAMSGYASSGWAIADAEEDSLALKRYFSTKYGTPKQVFVTGHSMGGLMTVLLSERYPADFQGGMPICGAIEPALELLGAAFDSLLVFNYLLPGVLPAPEAIPAQYKPSDELTAEVQRKIDAHPESLRALLHYTKLKDSKDIAGAITFTTYIVKEIWQRAGGNPFDNRNTIYADMGDDNAFNAKVKRYNPDAKAVDYLRAYYTPTGRLERPMLAIHTTYDTLVPPRVPNSYGRRTVLAGTGDFFVQQFVPHDGHCNVTPEETASGFAQLRAWVDRGTRPQGGPVPIP